MGRALRLATMGVPVGGGGALLPFSDDFERTDGDLGNDWLYTAGKWTIASGAAVATPGLGDELLTNGNMETGDPPSSWTLQNGATLDGVADERTGGAGAQSLEATRGTADTAFRQIKSGLTVGGLYRVAGYIKNGTATSGYLTGFSYTPKIAATSWTATHTVYFSDNTGKAIAGNVLGSAGQTARFDDLSLKLVTFKDCFALRDCETANVKVSADVYITGAAIAGIAACWDSVSNPQNGLVASIYPDYYGGPTWYLVLSKYLAGAHTKLAQVNVGAFTSSDKVSLEHASGTVRIYLNDVQVGVDYALDAETDAAIIAGTLHGLFNTDSSNTLDDLSIVTAPT